MDWKTAYMSDGKVEKKAILSICERYSVAEHGIPGTPGCHYEAWRRERTHAHPLGLRLGNYSTAADAKARCELDAADYAQDRRAG